MRRSTVVLVVLFAALGLLYWYMQKPGNVIKQALATSTPTAPALSADLLSPNQGPISKISIQDATGKAVSLQKAGGIWLVTAGHEAPANQDFSEAIARQILSLRMDTKLEKAPDLASIGLDNPDYTVSLILQDGSPYTFKIGATTVTDSGYYVQANDGSIGVIGKDTIDMLINLIAEPPFLPTITPAVPEITVTPVVTPTTKP
jgi:hypothetical protein